jgi:hypothetical protein
MSEKIEVTVDAKPLFDYIAKALNIDASNVETKLVIDAQPLVEMIQALERRVSALENQYSDAFKIAEDVLKKSWAPTNKFIKDMIVRTVRDNFDLKEKRKRRTQESVFQKDFTQITSNEIDELDALTDEEKEELKRERLRKFVLE